MEKSQKLYERFNIHQRIQHIMLFTSFTVLAFTGLPIKFSGAGWAHLIMNLFGGFDNMFRVHLIGAVVLFICSAYHLGYLVACVMQGKRSWAQMPTLKDVTDLVANMKYFLGVSQERPKFDRYSYKEKFDYWAVFWGMVIIGGSGLIMWFPGFFAQYLPRWFMSVSRVAHSDEAMLAVLAIFIWHIYNVHFSPSFFPGRRVWWDGKTSRSEMEHEHPMELERIEKQEKVKVHQAGF